MTTKRKIDFSWAVMLWHIECAACDTKSTAHPDDLMGDRPRHCPTCNVEIEHVDGVW